MLCKEKKFNVKGLAFVDCSNRCYSSTYNTLSILCRLHAVFNFNVALPLASRTSSVFITKPSSQATVPKSKFCEHSPLFLI